QITEKIVLEVYIFLVRGSASAPILRIHGFCRLLRRIVEMKRTEVCDLKFDADPAMLFVVLNEASDKLQVLVKRRRQRLQFFLRQFIPQFLFLQREINSEIAVTGNKCLVIKREEQGIDEKDPPKPLRREIRPKFDAVRHCLLDIEMIQNGVEILVALL